MAKFKRADFRPAREWIDKLPAESGARARAGAQKLIEASHLAEVRRALTVTQTELAGRSGLSQAEVSRIENNLASVQIRTLQKYVQGLGGSVCLVADFPDGTRATVPLRGGRPVKSKATVSNDKDGELVGQH